MSKIQHRLLVVDDEASIRDAFRSALTRQTTPGSEELDALEQELFSDEVQGTSLAAAYDVVFSSQGEEAVAEVQTAMTAGKPFGVVFLDMRMPPGIDGAETARRIRALDPAVNIVLVTGYSDMDVTDVAAQIAPADKLFFIAKPFQPNEIRQQAAALSARWKFESELIDELRAQTRAFQTMAAEASIARSHAEKANAAKSAFIANISHELRTPLHAIIGFSELMSGNRSGTMSDAQYRDFSAEIEKAGNYLLREINSLIETAKLDIGDVQLSLERFNIAELVETIASELKERAGCRSISIVAPGASPPFDVQADKKRMHQAITGVMQNAIKFSPTGGQVTVSLTVQEGRIVLSVSDNGPGMSVELINAVQNPFSQAETDLSRKHGGLGLGLFVAKGFVELHRGKLEITSEIGKTTTVSIQLPVDAASQCAA